MHLGDTVHFTLTNNSSIGMQHSIDFHAAMTPWDKNYQPVDPGQTKTFDWVAMYPGVFMYHCGVPPVLEHIANGMYGAIVVEPNNLPKEREYVLVSSEFYPGAKPVDGVYEGDYNRMLSAKPGFVVFNGVADQYKTSPLVARPERAVPHLGGERGPDAHERVPRHRDDVQHVRRRQPGERRCTGTRRTTSLRAAGRCSSCRSPMRACTRSSPTPSPTRAWGRSA